MGLDKKEETEKLIRSISESINQILRRNFPELALRDQEDISQEVRIKIWKTISSGKNIHNLRSYLWRVAYTTALDFINQKMKHVDFDEDRGLNPSSNPGEILDLSSELLFEEKEKNKVLMQEIEGLSQNRRIVIKLSLKGMSIKEIADFLGWSDSKVNHLYYRGLEDLKHRMKKGL